MAEKFSLDLDQLDVVSFATYSGTDAAAVPAESFPAVCTCIGICQPSADIYCSGGCPPQYPAAVE
jgi:hypothetical protein